MISRRFLVAVSALTLLSAVAEAQGPRSWVASSGSDTNACSRIAPCRNFSAAIAAVGLGGEVVALDSAGYGPVVVDKPVTLISPGGVHAAIAPTAGAAITISSGLNGSVILRGLYLNGQGAQRGINHLGSDSLFVEEMTINGFQQYGIAFAPATTPVFFVVDSTIRNNSNSGILWSGSFPGRGLVDRSRLERNFHSGLLIENSGNVAVRETLAANNSYGFFLFADGATLDITDSSAVNNGNSGFVAYSVGGSGVNMNMERCVASRNVSGVFAQTTAGAATIRVSNSTITNNDTGVFAGLNSSVLSRTNNTLESNGSGNTFPGTYDAK